MPGRAVERGSQVVGAITDDEDALDVDPELAEGAHDLGAYGAAVDPLEMSGAFQYREIASDGLAGDVEFLGERGHGCPPRESHLVDDRLLSLLGVHTAPISGFDHPAC